MNDEEFLRLTTLYLEDAIDPNDLELLNRDLANSPDRVRQFNDLRLLAGLLHDHDQEAGARTTAVRATDTPPDSKGFNSSADKSGFNVASYTRSRWVAVVTGTLLATLALLLVLQNFVDTNPGRDQDVDSIAKLAYTSHARWASGKRSLGDGLGEGRLHLEVGLARLDFRNGATVTLQGPAEFEILSAESTVLNHGILTASVPESAVGFEVATPTMDVVDLGTAFGVSVGTDGETDVCVFEGEVEVSRNKSTNVPQLVREGHAVRSKPEADRIVSVNYSTTHYEDAWPVTSGVLQATGLMKFVSPGPDFVPGKYEDSGHLLVFPERQRVLLKSDLEVNVTNPGQYIRVRRKNLQPILAGQRIRSYLIQLNPIGEFTRKEVGGARVIGQITFDRPILGLIGGTSQLMTTDELLGHPLGDYGGQRRGIEPTRPDDLPDSGRDHVILSQDRKTLSLDLSASSAVDQIRVIVSEDP